MTKISVIIPVYNTATLLERCLDSLLQQTFSDYEVILINDGSTDGSLHILEKYTTKNNKFKLINQANAGQSAARNRGLEKARGEYVFFLDSDDYLPREALEIFIKTANLSQADVVVSDEILPAEKENIYHVYKFAWKLYDFPLSELVKHPKIASSACNKLYKASVIKEKRFIEGIYFEDWPFITTLFGTIKNYASISIPLYIYDTSHISTTRSPFNLHKIKSYIIGVRYVYNFFKQTDLLELANCRILRAINMLVNKVYKSKSDKDLVRYLHSEIFKLCAENIIEISALNLKTKYRLWKMGIVILSLKKGCPEILLKGIK